MGCSCGLCFTFRWRLALKIEFCLWKKNHISLGLARDLWPNMAVLIIIGKDPNSITLTF